MVLSNDILRIRDVLTLLSDKHSSVVAKDIGIAEKKVRTVLKDAGYTYSQKTKQWEYTGDAPEPLDNEFIPAMSIPPQKKAAPRTPKIQNPEIQTSKEVAATSDNIVDKEMYLYQQVKALYINASDKNKVRKTYVIEEEVAKQFDEFAKNIPFDKSDLVTTALKEFIQKYK